MVSRWGQRSGVGTRDLRMGDGRDGRDARDGRGWEGMGGDGRGWETLGLLWVEVGKETGGMERDVRVLPARRDYRKLLSFQKAEIVYDITFRFAHKFLAKGDRTIDQMIQAARSGKKNILEGSKAGLTSKETEIKLTNVARASLEELLDDYRDFLRSRDFPEWDKESREAKFVRARGRVVPQSYEVYREFVETRPAEVVANIAICLIHQTNYLIDRQLRRLEKDFLEQGGLRERMTRARLERRAKAAKG